MLSAMETRRWTNPTQPQTLQIAVFLLYANAAFAALRAASALISGNPIFLLTIILIVGGALAGNGITNEHRWAYTLGVGVAGLDVLFYIGNIINLAFAIALMALLLHPQSRDYQRIWFR